MTASVPTVEPLQVRAGETWKWRRENLVSDYPASAWTLKYALKNTASHIEITATADGEQFAITVAAITTAGYTAGSYRWHAWVEGGSSEKYPVGTGTLDVLPVFASTAALDDRSSARKILDSIRAVLEGRASKDQEEYTIMGRSLKRTPLQDLREHEIFYANRVSAEEAEEALNSGRVGARRLLASG